MITVIELTNFKCFVAQELRTRELTIIAGGNAAGKSSIVQALLLLRQAYVTQKSLVTAPLAGQLVNLLNAAQILSINANTPEVRITVTDDSMEEDYWLEIPDASMPDRQPPCIVSENFEIAEKESSLFSDTFVYLNASRIVPSEEYVPRHTTDTDSRLGDRSGHRTVFRLIEALDNNETLSIPSLDLAGDSSVASNVSAWLSYIMANDVAVTADGSFTEGRATLQFTPSKGAAPVAALNMAFGHTYILPIIVGVLTAIPGSMMIIENPEAHLHPKAQLRMGEFLARAAENGVQIIVETHSDHLLNGVRVSAKKGEIDAGRVAVHFIESRGQDHLHEELELHSDGSLSDWPAGFFDEWEKALRDIISTGE